jgi:hypothetical protein
LSPETATEGRWMPQHQPVCRSQSCLQHAPPRPGQLPGQTEPPWGRPAEKQTVLNWVLTHSNDPYLCARPFRLVLEHELRTRRGHVGEEIVSSVVAGQEQVVLLQTT